MRPAGEVVVAVHSLGISTDVVIFTVHEERLSVVLVRRDREPFRNCWSLPGGVVGREESLDTAARRWLGERTGIRGVYLEQLYTFGRPERDPRGRVVTVAYFALLPFDRVRPGAVGDGVLHDVRALPDMAFDHGHIVGMAHSRLVAKLDYSTIALQLMPDRFTLSQLQSVYEVILGESLDKRNFRKRLLTMDCVEETGDTLRTGPHRPARLYRTRQPDRVRFVK